MSLLDCHLEERTSPEEQPDKEAARLHKYANEHYTDLSFLHAGRGYGYNTAKQKTGISKPQPSKADTAAGDTNWKT